MSFLKNLFFRFWAVEFHTTPTEPTGTHGAYPETVSETICGLRHIDKNSPERTRTHQTNAKPISQMGFGLKLLQKNTQTHLNTPEPTIHPKSRSKHRHEMT